MSGRAAALWHEALSRSEQRRRRILILPSQVKKVVEAAVKQSGTPAPKSISERLGLLVVKRRRELEGKNTTPESLWLEIAARTDEIYLVAEPLRDEFIRVTKELMRACGLEVNEETLKVGPLKDPIRIHGARLCEPLALALLLDSSVSRIDL